MKLKEIRCPACSTVFGHQIGRGVMAMGYNDRWYIVEEPLMCRCSRCGVEWVPGQKDAPLWPGNPDTPTETIRGLTPAGKLRVLAKVYSGYVWIEYGNRVLVARRLLSVDAPECSVVGK